MSETKKKVELGLVYSARVGGAFVAVRADKSLGHGRYEGTTMRLDGTGSTVKFATDAVRGDGMPETEWREIVVSRFMSTMGESSCADRRWARPIGGRHGASREADDEASGCIWRSS